MHGMNASAANVLDLVEQQTRQGHLSAALEQLRQAHAHPQGLDRQDLAQRLIQGKLNALGRATAFLNAPQDRSLLSDITRSLSIQPNASLNPNLSSAQRAQTDGKGQQFRSPSRQKRQTEPEPPAPDLATLAENCLAAKDVFAAIDHVLATQSFTAQASVNWYLTLSEKCLQHKDRLTAEHFANLALHAFPKGDRALAAHLISQLIKVGRQDTAMTFAFEQSLLDSPLAHRLDKAEKTTLSNALQQTTAKASAKGQHGQALLLAYLKEHLADYAASLPDRRPVLIEVGTTREDVSGQGSTRQFAEFCLQHSLDFITVDMDPHNSQMARELFQQIGCKAQAVTQKGEDYLRDYQGPIDFVFLDAYDFDHGKHSELRQSRYQQFLGSRIDEQQCHQMHLDCAQSLNTKLAPQGVICFDDTWLDKGHWTAKGTLAMPYLLEHGFDLLEARNRAALLRRRKAN